MVDNLKIKADFNSVVQANVDEIYKVGGVLYLSTKIQKTQKR